jgi:hypothetical protein
VHEPCPSKDRGRRESRVSDAPAASCTKVESTRVRNHRLTGSIRLSLHNGFNGFLRALLGDRAFLPPSLCGYWRCPRPGRAWHASTKLDASVGASGPHDFTVRDIVVRLHACESLTIPKDRALQPRPRTDAVASTASRPAFRDDREPPLWGRDGALIEVILARTKAEYFSRRGWTLIC